MSKSYITDLDRIQRLTEEQVAEDSRFRQFLKGDLGFSDEELDVLVWEVLAEVAPAIDCLACANCCRVAHPALTPEEIGRLAPRIGLTPEEFRLRHISQIDGELYIKASPCPFLEGNRCTVYEERPEVCREYPHLHKPDFSHRTLSILGNIDVCPIVFNVWRLLKDRTGFRREHRHRRHR